MATPQPSPSKHAAAAADGPNAARPPAAKRAPTAAPKAPTSIEPGAIVANHAVLTGEHLITIAAGAVVHPYGRLTSADGPVEVGEGAVVWEKGVVGSRGRDRGEKGAEGGSGRRKTVLKRNAVVETGAVVEAGAEIGEGTVLEAYARIGEGAVVGQVSVVFPFARRSLHATRRTVRGPFHDQRRTGRPATVGRYGPATARSSTSQRFPSRSAASPPANTANHPPPQHCKLTPHASVPARALLPDFTVVFGHGRSRTDDTLRSNAVVQELKASAHEKRLGALRKLVVSNLAKWQ